MKSEEVEEIEAYMPEPETLKRLQDETAKRDGFVVFAVPLIIRAKFQSGFEQNYTAIGRNSEKFVLVQESMPNITVDLAANLVINNDVTGVVAALAGREAKKVNVPDRVKDIAGTEKFEIATLMDALPQNLEPELADDKWLAELDKAVRKGTELLWYEQDGSYMNVTVKKEGDKYVFTEIVRGKATGLTFLCHSKSIGHLKHANKIYFGAVPSKVYVSKMDELNRLAAMIDFRWDTSNSWRGSDGKFYKIKVTDKKKTKFEFQFLKNGKQDPGGPKYVCDESQLEVIILPTQKIGFHAFTMKNAPYPGMKA